MGAALCVHAIETGVAFGYGKAEQGGRGRGQGSSAQKGISPFVVITPGMT